MTSLETAHPAAFNRATWDVLVIGAGPAGAVAALQAARQGLRTLLVDAKHFPRRKACGGCLSHGAVSVLCELGLSDVLHQLQAPPIHRVRFRARGRTSELPLPTGRAIDRATFDQALVQKGVEAGVCFVPGCTAKVLGVQQDFQQIRLHTPDASLIASTRVAIVADGLLRGSLGTKTGDAAPARTGSRIGVAALLTTGPRDLDFGEIDMTIARRGYAGRVRLDAQRTLLASAVDRQCLRDGSISAAVVQLLDECPADLRDAMEAADWHATPELTRTPSAIAGERWFAIGDAAGYVEPFTGDGMAAALETGAAVTPWVVAFQRAWKPELATLWTQEHRRIVSRRRMFCRTLAWMLRRPSAVGALLTVCRHAPRLAGRTFAAVQRRTHHGPSTLAQAVLA